MGCGERMFVGCQDGHIVRGRGRITEEERELSTVIRRNNWRELSDMSAIHGRRDQR